MDLGDTIVASASGPTAARRAVIRVSGPGTFEAIRSITWVDVNERDAVKEPQRGVHRLVLSLASAVADETTAGELNALMISMPGPRSYTGEDTAELIVPGSPIVVERIVAMLTDLEGVRPATPGEFSARAYLAGRLTVEQAEGVGALIAARSDAERSAAERLASGETGTAYAALSDRLATALALVEAGIDFTDQEDVVAIAPADLRTVCVELLSGLSELLGAGKTEAVASRTACVVLAGAPNAGKSTLFNALLGQTRVIASPISGSTRDAVRERLTLGSESDREQGSWWGVEAVELVDLAGLDAGPAAAVDAEAQRTAAELIASADVVVWCDPSGAFDAGCASGRPVVRASVRGAAVLRVRTKADQVPRDQATRSVRFGWGHRVRAGDDREDMSQVLGVCALDLFNIAPLRRAIGDSANTATRSGVPGTTLLARHRGELAAARAAINEVVDLLPTGDAERHLPEPELIAGCLREALDALGSLAGEISPDDVIGRVFASFCVGK